MGSGRRVDQRVPRDGGVSSRREREIAENSEQISGIINGPLQEAFVVLDQ
jgi:hypothetical protein